MNEQILELAKQADPEFTSEYNDDMGHALVGTKAIEKFAELIVRECMEQVWYSREDGINGNVSEVIKDRIKQHFGVEE